MPSVGERANTYFYSLTKLSTYLLQSKKILLLLHMNVVHICHRSPIVRAGGDYLNMCQKEFSSYIVADIFRMFKIIAFFPRFYRSCLKFKFY